MTDLRKAAKEALWAFQYHIDQTWPTDRSTAAIAALRAALAQQDEPVEPVAWSGYDLDGMVEALSRVVEAHYQRANPFQNPVDMDAQMALRILRGFIPAMKAYTAPPQRPAEPAQEPVAWMVYTEGGASAYVTDNPRDLIGAYKALPLYTAPPQRQPLTEEEILKAIGWERAEMYMKLTPNFPIEEARKETIKNARAVERAHGIKE